MGKLVRNTIFVVGGQTFTKIISFFSVPIIARLLGTEWFGIYTLSFSFVMLFSGIADFGIENLTIRDISRDSSKLEKYLFNSLVVRFFIALIIYFLIILSAKFLGYSEQIFQLIAILGMLIFANFLINTLNAFVISLEKMGISSLVLMIQNIINPCTALIMLLLNYSVKNIFFAIIALNFVLSLIYLFVACRSVLRIKLKIDFALCKYLLINGLPFALVSIFGYVYIYNVVIIISKFAPIADVGIFNAAFKLMLSLTFIPTSLIIVFFPSIARKSIDTVKTYLKESTENAIRALFLIAFPLAITYSLLSKQIINTLFDIEFSNAAPVLAVLGWAMLFFFLSAPLTLVIINSKHVKKFVVLFLIITITSLVTNTLIVSFFGYYGASWSFFLLEICRFILYFIFIKRYLKLNIDLTGVIKTPLLLGIPTALFILALGYAGLNLVIILLLSFVFYLLSLILAKEYIFISLLKKAFKIH
ncbi:oligosaccharide flippase family protein [Patescibacteria group bacterium]|nr:oligosaccharide flippase family protein [Patescibacteria group bacterium]MBU1075144.1 oligosaccharide flippase family protein [Patescibacteria group bacterium]MBU1951367.1 oligosaccharide flippase family protein [Patescibacteria group bacterium]